MKQLHALIALASILALGLALRLHAASPYLFYPDSYTSLMVAHNLATYHAATGTLGPGGMLYPDFFAWTRPFYPALIAVASIFTNPITAAHAINILSGIGAILLAYLLATRLFTFRLAGLFAALLLAISWNAVTWSGFIFTETAANFMLLLALAALLARRIRPAELADPWDFLTGALLALATLTRYEYAVILIPSLIISARPFAWSRTFNLAAAYAFVLALAFFALRPFAYGPGAALAQTASFIPLLALATLAACLLYLLRRRLHLILLAGLWLFALALPFLPHALQAPRTFFATDPLIGLLALLGLTLMLLTPKFHALAAYLTICAALLAAVYYHINPAMQRYWTHLLPFLIIPAAYGALVLVKKTLALGPSLRFAAAATAAIAIILQVAGTTIGLHSANNGLWFKPGYEEVSAKRLAPTLPPHALIIAALPEPYFFFTDRPTQSLADQPPYLYLPPSVKSDKIIIIQDQAMRELFPKFSGLLDAKFQSAIIRQYAVGENFRYITRIEREGKRVNVYDVSYADLQTAITHEGR